MKGGGRAAADVSFIRFLTFYSVIMIVVYSAIPYKTPWIMLGFLHGLILLACVGTVVLLQVRGNRIVRAVAMGVLVAGCVHLAAQSYLSNTRYYADPANPYVYAQTTDDVLGLVDRVEAVAAVHPAGREMYIEVISPGHDYWPLPWYLRAFPNVGWWDQVDMEAPAAPVIIAAPSVEPTLLRKLYEVPPPGQRDLYVPLLETYTELRPAVEIRGYVVKSLWDRYQQQR
jgi:predicted membrane-bound mannosyltransferase